MGGKPILDFPARSPFCILCHFRVYTNHEKKPFALLFICILCFCANSVQLKTAKNHSVYADFSTFVLLYRIPLFYELFLFLSYINQSPCFSNSDTIICKTRRFILIKRLFKNLQINFIYYKLLFAVRFYYFNPNAFL